MGNTRMPTREFEQSIALLVAATGKDLAAVLNKKIVDVGFRAAKHTPKKNPAEIEAELRKDKIGLKIVTKQLTGRKGKTYTTRAGKVRTIKRVTRKQIALRTRQFVSRRKKRTGFMRAGWVAALVAGGFPVRSMSGRIKDSKSKLGVGKKATANSLIAMIGNNVWGRLDGKNKGKAQAQMYAALERAIKEVSKDTSDYAIAQLQKSADKVKGKRR